MLCFQYFILFEKFTFKFILRSFLKLQWIWKKIVINGKNLKVRKSSLEMRNPGYNKNRKLINNIEIITESMPQLVFQYYLYRQKNSFSDLFDLFFKSTTTANVSLKQARSIVTSSLSIIFGLSKVFGLDAFYKIEPKLVKAKKIRHIAVYIWYFLIVIPRLYLISLLVSMGATATLFFLSINLIKSFLLSSFDTTTSMKSLKFKYYFHETKIYFLFLNFCYSIVGVYKNIFIQYENAYHRRNAFKYAGSCYLFYYYLLYMQNIALYNYLHEYIIELNVIVKMFLVFGILIAAIVQMFYEIIENKLDDKSSFSLKLNEKKGLEEYYNKYDAYISGDLSDKQNQKLVKWLNYRFNMECYCSFGNEEDYEKNFVRMMDAKLIISFHNQKFESNNLSNEKNFKNAKIYEREIETAKKLNKRILFINKSKPDQNSCKRTKNEIIKILKTDFGLIKSLKSKNKHQYKQIDSINTFFIYYIRNILHFNVLKKEKKLVFMGKDYVNKNSYFLYYFDMQNNKLTKIDDIKVNNDCLVCVNNSSEQIIIFDNQNSAFKNYDFNFHFKNEIIIDKKKLRLHKIFVDKSNGHIYGMNHSTNKLFHFNEKHEQIEEFCWSQAKYLNTVIARLLYTFPCNHISNDNPHVSVYKIEKNKLKLQKYIHFDPFIFPSGVLAINEKYIMLHGHYDKMNLFMHQYFFLMNHQGLLLQKTNVDFAVNLVDFIMYDDYFNIYCLAENTKEEAILVKISFYKNNNEISNADPSKAVVSKV